MMLRTFQFRLKPNATQAAALTYVLSDNCETYNAALQERREAWKISRKPITIYDQQAELTALRNDPQYLAFLHAHNRSIISCAIQQDSLRRVDRAFKAFFRRCKAGEKPGFPRFRSWRQYDSFTFSRPTVRVRSIKIPNVGDIRARGGRLIEGRAKTCTVKRDGKRWTASVVCDIGEAPPKRIVRRATGIDVGVSVLATLSDGTKLENPRWTKQHEERIARAGQALSRKQRGSNNQLRAKEVLRRAHQRVADARKNYLHHASKWLVVNYDLIAHEALNIKGMAQGRLAKSIHDAAWGALLWQLHYKAESAGVHVVAVDPRGTSQRCSGCSDKVPKPLGQRVHLCPGCGLELGRDHNAARNILALGLSAAPMTPPRLAASKGYETLC